MFFIFFIKLCSIIKFVVSSTAEDGFCDNDSCKLQQKCVYFDEKTFGPENKSIVFGEARGRIGNQLLGKYISWIFKNLLKCALQIFYSSKARCFWAGATCYFLATWGHRIARSCQGTNPGPSDSQPAMPWQSAMLIDYWLIWNHKDQKSVRWLGQKLHNCHVHIQQCTL